MIKIINQKELVENAIFEEDKRARRALLRILEMALNSVEPKAAIKGQIYRVENKLVVGDLTFNLDEFRRIFVVGGGKAGGAMAEALEEMLGDRITRGVVNVLRGTKSRFRTSRIILNEASHPIPDEDGMRGAEAMIKLAEEAGEKDLVICLISGGGSALMPLPAEGITLRDQQILTDLLLKSGASINEINAVRKHISKLKGGQLAKAAYPATLISLVLSDVVGDPLDSIASGPTVPDTTTFRDAILVLKKYNLWERTPEAIRNWLEAGFRGVVPETPKPGDEVFNRSYAVIVGNNRLAALAARDKAEKMGFNTLFLSSMIEGEARHVGTVYAGIVREILASDNPIPRPAVVIAGGETTVTVTGKGRGGRNQELVLSASLKMDGLRGVAIASIGTDGIDGPTDAAGAIADGQTAARARNKNLDLLEFLMDNNSYAFFSELGDLIFTGPTGTNVNDLTVMVVV